MKRNEFRFLISQRVPNAAWPIGRTDTFASQRNEPSCMLPSQMPSQTTSACSAFAYATASADERISGSLTISSSGVPARLRSMPLDFSPCRPAKSSCSDLPASSSRCARVSRTVFTTAGPPDDPPSTTNVTRAALDDRPLVLADLVALRKVRIEVVLPREDRHRRDRRADRESEADRALDGAAIEDRQRARQREVDRRRLRVRRGAERRRRAAEDLGGGRELRVRLEADDGFPVHDALQS